MAYCDLCAKCFFFNEPLFDNLMRNAENYRRKYCGGSFTECSIYKLAMFCGIQKVPGYANPDDFLENVTATLSEVSQPQKGNSMLTKVIFSNGSLGKARSSSVDYLTKLGKIVAYQCSMGWVEARRKLNNKTYVGPERRRSNFPLFN